jgi:hypothetical protein
MSSAFGNTTYDTAVVGVMTERGDVILAFGAVSAGAVGKCEVPLNAGPLEGKKKDPQKDR